MKAQLQPIWQNLWRGYNHAMVFVMPIVSFVIPLGLAYWVRRRGLGWLVALWSATLVVVMVWAILKGRALSGWDGMGYTIVAVLMLAPAVLGSGAGAALAWWRARKP